MNQFPNFSEYGYEAIAELSQNRVGGRVTYLAIDQADNQKVVIKQFQFAKTSSTWNDYDAYEREIQTLKGLKHPGIPSYLNSFHTDDGFCMVQEYKHASSLSEPRSFAPDQIRQIAIAALNILVYLQNRVPPVIHRDIKPENILVDEEMNVYLVDFGFARVGHGEVGVSSVVKGTLGFMPPEQLFNRQLTEASDLYSLGITLICLLTATRSNDVGKLIDITYQVDFKHLTSKISPRWVRWLEKMVEPRIQQRYANAAEALSALPDDLVLPEAIFSQARFALTALRQGQRLTQTVSIQNHVPLTQLEGHWEVAPHPSDPPHSPDHHGWIMISPRQFVGNNVECEIVIDTSKLMSDKLYTRQLLLHTNATAKTYTLDLQIQTAPIPHKATANPYGILGLLLGFSLVCTWFTVWVAIFACAIFGSSAPALFSSAAGACAGLLLAAWLLDSSGSSVGARAAVTGSIALGVATLLLAWSFSGEITVLGVLTGAIVGTIGGLILGGGVGYSVEKLFKQRFPAGFTMMISLMTSAWGLSIGVGLIVGFLNPLVVLAALSTGVPLLGMVVQLPLKRVKFVTDFRKAERHLIKP